MMNVNAKPEPKSNSKPLPPSPPELDAEALRGFASRYAVRSLDEVAEILGLSFAAAWAAERRALWKLRRHLAPLWEEIQRAERERSNRQPQPELEQENAE